MKKIELLGYSERGIINSLIFSISNNKELMDKFVELIDIPKLNKLGKPIDYEILLEQSFSGFGDADLIIILKYKSHKKVLFIEGKVKTFHRKSWTLENQYNKFKKGKYPGYSSNLFYQLYLKHLLFDNKTDIEWENECISNWDSFSVNCGIRNRKIGNNKIVWKALKRVVDCDEAFYIGLVPSNKQENDLFKGKLKHNIHFLSWKDVHDFCNNNEEELKPVLDVFEFNKGQIYRNVK